MSFLQVGFRFQYQFINLDWLPFDDLFSISWSLSTCISVALCSSVCSCPKISRNVFYLLLFTFLVLILQSNCFIYTTWTRKQIMEQQPHSARKRMKSKQKQDQVASHSNWTRVPLFDLARKQCSEITCNKSEGLTH